MKTRHIISLLAAMVLLFVGTGCSYKKIDETLQSAVQQEVDSGVDGYTSDGRAYVEVPRSRRTMWSEKVWGNRSPPTSSTPCYLGCPV